MTIREDLVTSAVSFLNDPKVQLASLQKRIAFLESKRLTKEEIDEAISRAASHSQSSSFSPIYYPNAQNPPELPRRDWRDWFIMGVVGGSVAYGLTVLVRRYVMPLIAPPTPEALQADKDSIDAQFDEAQSLLKQLQEDSEQLKKDADDQKNAVNEALRDLDRVMDNLRKCTESSETELRNLKHDINSLKALVPEALEKHKDNQEAALVDLQTELKSLKTLIVNRGRPIGSQGTNVSPILPIGNSSSAVPESPTTAAIPSIPVWQHEMQAGGQSADGLAS
ncbi:Peroxisomal membrane protein pex14 [Neolecta irregularis DAH-3]|uniref:Peroxisomal membrane protein PEX14 n=1 Tax=Neolecta irregularis (strain DAH-3) TaxID=1198029 RepID=A0A1U7LW87_NEOID|nr:Peroxisomal membrane protein pex14 [Neolecta irregularis DAH-3]|eukprot:OLL26946.1 Peroxisomal membrane protein pex14 [Neolecta irregularis DAH-3]